MPDSYRLKPKGGPRGGNGAGPGVAMAFTATHPSAEPAIPPTHSVPWRAEGRDGECGRPETPSPAPMAGPPRNAASSRSHARNGGQVSLHLTPAWFAFRPAPWSLPPLPKGKGGRRQGD